jgi:hypothetical protein
MGTAHDVTTGHCNPATGGYPAKPGPDLATGNGLVDAHKAVLIAKLRCASTIKPPIRSSPISPMERTIMPTPEPTPPAPWPILPEPIEPIRRPIEPIRRPINPIRRPIDPIRKPIDPIRYKTADELAADYYAGYDVYGEEGLSEEDVSALESMIGRGEIDSDDID